MARKRSVARELLNLLQAGSRPIYCLDERRRIVFCNEACCSWLGTTAEALVGQLCNYGAGAAAPGDLTSALCPPPEVFEGEVQSRELLCLTGATRLSRRKVTFSPLGTGQLDPAGVIAVVEPDEVSPAQAGAGRDDQSLHQRLQALAVSLRAPYRLERLVGESPAVSRVREQVAVAIAAQARVAIHGVPGSGGETIARTIHAGSDPSSAGPLMPLTCDLIDADLLQTTVTAFMRRCLDAQAESADHAEAGDGSGEGEPRTSVTASPPGTVLLLEVDRLSLEAQLEMMAFFELPVFNLRTIVTSRRRLLDLADEECFHRPLALALSPLEIELPPLAERRGDIPFLAQQFVEDFNAQGGRQFSGLTTEAFDQLCALPWQGDVDELAELIGQACAQAEGPSIGLADLPKRVALLTSAAAHPPPAPDERIQLDEFLAEIEGELIQRAMERTGGNKTQAARLLGVNRARLIRKLGPQDEPMFVEQPDDPVETGDTDNARQPGEANE